MERREFVTVMGSALALGRSGGLSDRSERPAQQPTAEVFARRLERLQQELKTRGLDLFVAEPSTNFQYLTGYNPGRSERLILLMIPATGAPAVICPSFEVERLKRNSIMGDVRG